MKPNMKVTMQFKKFSITTVCALALAACGGGGGGGGSAADAPIVKTITGSAAVGHPISGAFVKVSCASGAALTSSPTTAQGAWQVTLTDQEYPCAVQLTGGTVNGVPNVTDYHSLALAGGTVNVTPLTDMLVANLTGNATPSAWFAALTTPTAALDTFDQSKVDAALTKLRAAFPLLTPLASLNPITASFTPVAGNATDDMLEALKNAIANAAVPYATLLANAAAPGFTAPSEAFVSTLAWAFRSTGSGGNSYHTSTIVTTAPPAPTYASASEEEAAFNLLNAERSRCGFGYLAQNTQIDQAAGAHAQWQLFNQVISHFEDSAVYPTGFTGYSVLERLAYQSYTDIGEGSDLFSVRTGSNTKLGYGTVGIRGLLSAPFHLRGLVNGHRDIGLIVKNNIDASTPASAIFLQIDMAYKATANKQLQASDVIQTYPCEGTVGVNYRLTNESPNPVPGRDLSALPLGHPVMIKVRDGNTLVVATATMENAATHAPVVLRSAATTRADDTSGRFSQSEAYVIPDAPLSQNTSYKVVITGTNSAVPFTKTFTFTTGSGG